ncbi:methyl-accepting chemotaxis protein [Castellaniella caeni]
MARAKAIARWVHDTCFMTWEPSRSAREQTPMNIRNRKISTRLAIGFGVLLLLMALVAAIGIYRLYDNIKLATASGEREVATAMISEWKTLHNENNVRTITEPVVRQVDPAMADQLKQAMAATVKRISALQAKVDARLTDPKARELFDAIAAKRKAYVDARSAAQEAQRQGRTQEADQFFKHDIDAYLEAYSQGISRLLEYQNSLGDSAEQTMRTTNHTGILVVAIASLIALLIGILYSSHVERGITHPLARALKAAEAISRRDLTVEIRARYQDEMGQLMRALAAMTQNLREVIQDVHSGTAAIASAAGQISAGNTDLASRTEEQAASLTETAATMEEITATVRQNGENVAQATTLSGAASKVASEGGEVVHELIATMSEVDKKSKEVTEITAVIESIAFQTNILALNAAVEAARAGEQGRGFAVVASEVRALAQRSAAAAKDIKTLIEASVVATSQGARQAERTSEAMQNIVESIQRVTDIMVEINAANHEQVSGIEQIDTAVTQLDSVTRQNASLVEASAAAAANLSKQADALAHLVDTFQLSASAPANETSAGYRADSSPRTPTLPGKSTHPAPRRMRAPKPDTSRHTPGGQPTVHSTSKAVSNITDVVLRAPGRPAPDQPEEWTSF